MMRFAIFTGQFWAVGMMTPPCTDETSGSNCTKFLLAHDRTVEAKEEIAGLAADTPADDGALLEQDGRLLLKVGEPAKAFVEFEAALKTNPRQSQWLTEAGQIAFEEGDLLKAETYFSRAERENPSQDTHTTLVLIRDALGNDPFLAGLSEGEQARRTWRDFEQGLDRLRMCGMPGGAGSTASLSSQKQPPDMQLLDKDAQDLKKRVTLTALSRSPDLRSEAMQLVFRIEAATSESCGPASGMDEALKLIEKRHQGTNS